MTDAKTPIAGIFKFNDLRGLSWGISMMVMGVRALWQYIFNLPKSGMKILSARTTWYLKFFSRETSVNDSLDAIYRIIK